jgi:hypothetical protein
MKTNLTIICLLTGTAVPAFAFPFVNHDLLSLTGTMPRIRVFHDDGDRNLDFSLGANVMHRVNGTQTFTVLPEPDPDPYLPSDPNVWFGSNRVAAGDIDGDGDSDLVQSSGVYYGSAAPSITDDYRIITCLNDGQGNYTRGWQWKGNSNTSEEPELHLADMDGDGDLDLIEGFDAVRIRWNPGNGNYGSATVLDSINLDAYGDFVTADFNRDGLMDLVAFGDYYIPVSGGGKEWHGRSILYSGKAGGGFTVTILASLPKHDEYIQGEIHDLDRDGRPDLVFTRVAAPSSVAWMRNNGTGFDATATLLVLPNYARPQFALGDLDEDGWSDIVFSSEYKLVQWARSTGPAAFGAPLTLFSSNNPKAYAGALVITDVDGDGDQDVLCNSGVQLLENTAIHPKADALPFNWAGTSPGAGTVDLHTANIDGNSRMDLLATDPAGQRILWYPGGHSTFTSPFTLSTSGESPTCVSAGDFDGDGLTDIAWTTGSAVKWARNVNGTGIGWITQTALSLAGLNQVVAADGDRDGDTDLLVSATATGSVRWLFNNGSGSAWTSQTVTSGAAGVQRLAVGQTLPGGRPEVELILTKTTGESGWFRYQYSSAQGTWSLQQSVNQTGANPSLTSTGLTMGAFTADSPFTGTAFKTGHPANVLNLRPSAETYGGFTTIRNLDTVDWNRDGFPDLLAASESGAQLYMRSTGNSGPFSLVSPFLSSPGMADMVPFDLDHDSRMDAVAVENSTGKLHLVYNSSHPMDITLTPAKPAGEALKMMPGTQSTVVTLSAKNNGVAIVPAGRSPDAQAVPESCEFYFRRAVASGNGYVPGSVMTDAEINAVVKRVRFATSASYPAGSTNGRFSLEMTSFIQAAQAVNPGATRSYALSLELENTALSAPVTRFYVDIAGAAAAPVRWFPISSTGEVGPLPLATSNEGGSLPSVLVEVTAPTPLQQWRMANFSTYDGTGNAANAADPDKDGVPNLVEYVMGRNPKSSTAAETSQPVLNLTVQQPPLPAVADLTLRNAYDPSVKLDVEFSHNLQTWSILASRTGTGSWSGSAPFLFGLPNGMTKFVFNTAHTPSQQARLYVRLRASEVP